MKTDLRVNRPRVDPSLVIRLGDAPVDAPERAVSEPRVLRASARKQSVAPRMFGLAVLAIALSLFVYLFFNSWVRGPDGAETSSEVSQLVNRVGALMLLPEGETPVIATVSDPSVLSDQVFFSHAKIGDKVLMFTEARKAILYRPSEDRIIEVGPITSE